MKLYQTTNASKPTARQVYKAVHKPKKVKELYDIRAEMEGLLSSLGYLIFHCWANFDVVVKLEDRLNSTKYLYNDYVAMVVDDKYYKKYTQCINWRPLDWQYKIEIINEVRNKMIEIDLAGRRADSRRENIVNFYTCIRNKTIEVYDNHILPQTRTALYLVLKECPDKFRVPQCTQIMENANNLEENLWRKIRTWQMGRYPLKTWMAGS